MTPAEITSIIGVILCAIFLVFAEHRVERTKGKNIWFHLIFIVFAAAVLLLMPDTIQYDLFSPLGVVIVGSIFPIYESIRAVCTPGTEDDTAWLQYWVAQGLVSYSTEWVDHMAQTNPSIREHWYEFELFFMLWLMLPYTDGSSLTFEYITKPLFGNLVDRYVTKMEGWITMVVMTFINSMHLWLLWAVFVIMPASIKRFMTVTLGTVYPLMASIVAVTSPEGTDDTQWLTYWSCFGCTYVIMDWLEEYLGKVPGFYTVVIFFIVYLMLPLFQGANQVFRNILVPITGQHEMLILRDAHLLRMEMEAKVSPERWKSMRKAMAASFAHDDDDDDDDGDEEEGTGYGSTSKAKEPTEDEPLIAE